MNHDKWIKKHISEPFITPGFYGETDEQKKRAKKVLEEFLADHPTGKKANVAGGVLGETQDNQLFVKEEIREGGVKLKFYGVDFFLRGNPKGESVFGLELAKSNLFQLPRKLLKNPLVALSYALTFLFARKSIYRLLYWELNEIHWKVTRHCDPKPEEYNDFGRELKRVVHDALLKVFGIDNQRAYYPFDHPKFNKTRAYPHPEDLNDNLLGWCLALFSRFIITFLEVDFAYRFRVQDAFKKDLTGFLDTLISRETVFEEGAWKSSGKANILKWKMIRAMLRVAFFLEPKAKEYVNEVLQNLDETKVKMDENDWYFCLGWTSYDFGGFTYEERMKMRKELDIKHNHVFWTLWNRLK